MLGKTAGGLFWMFRYLERAENTARLLAAGWHIALTRAGGSEAQSEWQSIITTAGMDAGFRTKYEEYSAEAVIDYLLRDKDNPSSVMGAISAARSNARLVRTALSSEVWEATNECWMEIKALLSRPITERALHDTLTQIRFRTSVVRGALHGTMLRNDIYAFSRLGTFVERADNTARILDVKYYVLLPSAAFVGQAIDNAQWEVILRSVSAESSYRWINGGESTPISIANFLILDDQMPRSLAFCAKKVRENLAFLERCYLSRQESNVLAEALQHRFDSQSIETIFEEGLHEFLTQFLLDNGKLAQQVEEDFRFNG
ncbi:alpha-E domain-containing protein [Cognatishimia sp. SS12]|uniref:alpha-E domain-containing protein n=1 Tax=Cognatishimia sp. SS12 TaxID=2979465 RepID=UPI00232AB326|nr:alpha-E domain-containing protein [Cognatishimia sp. SS12]MDC0739492.1 alpha-E domain-containing protein [Cognatishimia sp. SS12]